MQNATEATCTVDQAIDGLIGGLRSAELMGNPSPASALFARYGANPTDLLRELNDLANATWPQGRAARTQQRLEIRDALRFVVSRVLLAFETLGYQIEGLALSQRSPAGLHQLMPKEVERFAYLARCLIVLYKMRAVPADRTQELREFLNRWSNNPGLSTGALKTLNEVAK